MFERMDPKTLRTWLIIAAVAYFLLPYDLLPDMLGFPGRIDDLLMMAWLAWYYRNHLRRFVTSDSEDPSSGPEPQAGPEHERELDAYEVLGISRTASNEAIQDAYRGRMKEYHPDKVAHLGEELQKLAHEKSQQIQHAYQQLRR